MTHEQQKNNKRTAVKVAVVACCMLGLAFASVPLYQLFCAATGFGGQPGIDLLAENVGSESDREFTVRFDANTNAKLPWEFKPVQKQVSLRVGEQKLAHYEATNMSDKRLTGTAGFNVTPYKVAEYFNKIDCFCFTEQTLEPGEVVSMPVLFYIDSEIEKDLNAMEVKTFTLSYTFYLSPDQAAENEQDGAAEVVEIMSSDNKQVN